jgi:hypothetical protein
MFTGKIGNSSIIPAIPTGRLSAKTNSQVASYLTKVQDYEAAQSAPYNPADPMAKEWMKKILHFAGGSSFAEATMLSNYLNTYKDSLKTFIMEAQ